MKRSDCVIACGMIAVSLLSLCLFLHPAMAQTAAPDAAPEAEAATVAGQLPVMPEEDMTALNKFCKMLFYPALHPFFKRVNDALLLLPDRAAGVCGVGLFLSAMIWVVFFLNKDYVNRGRPYKNLFTDLRLWVVLSMTPHVLVYFYFR